MLASTSSAADPSCRDESIIISFLMYVIILWRPGTSGLLRLLDGDEVVCCFFSRISLDSLCFKGVALIDEGGADDLSFLLLDDSLVEEGLLLQDQYHLWTTQSM